MQFSASSSHRTHLDSLAGTCSHGARRTRKCNKLTVRASETVPELLSKPTLAPKRQAPQRAQPLRERFEVPGRPKRQPERSPDAGASLDAPPRPPANNGPALAEPPRKPDLAGRGKRDSKRPGADNEDDAAETARLKRLQQERMKKSKNAGRKGELSAEARRKARQQRKQVRDSQATTAEREEIFEVPPQGMALEEVAVLLAVPAAEVVRALFMRGIMAQVNQVLDPNTVKLVGKEFGVEVIDKDEDEQITAEKDVDFISDEDADQLEHRPPVVTVMGHVDHGKTSLLDYIRKTKVAAGEAGGITQTIGAYNVEVESGEGKKSLCFLDTPGHEAFSAMRARGAKVTDVAIIIVAADDGVRPQTLEAISHAKAAKVPIVVAINKIDKEGADIERVKQELAAQASLMPEEWGGDTAMVPISAKKGKGVDDLLEMVLFVAELEELQANPQRPAKGTVIEAHLDRRSGPVATLLVQNGTLRVGDIVCAGACYGKVRGLLDSRGQPFQEAGPSLAVQVLGLNAVPSAGDRFDVCASEQEAREQAEEEQEKLRYERLAALQGGGSRVTLSTLASIDDIEEEAIQRLNIIVKADAAGAVEAVKAGLESLPQDSVMLRFLHTAAGDINESDINLAAASEGLIIGFNLEPTESVLALAKQKGVQLQTYRVIYDLIDNVRGIMEGRIKAVEEKIPIGTAQVKAVFGSGAKRVAGCIVTDGRLEKNCVVQVMRNKKRVVYEGALSSLRRVKDIVEIVEQGTECGVGCDGFAEWQEGDVIEAFTVVEKQLKLEEAQATMAVSLEELQLEQA